MVVKCLGSGSSGNGWVIDSGEEAIIIDCGLPPLEAKKAVNFNILKIRGCAVSHEHKDHARYVDQYQRIGFRVALPYQQGDDYQTYHFGLFTVKTFPLVHDVPCYGFLIDHPDCRILYATDTEYIKYRFKNLNCIIVEANYAVDKLSDELDDTIKRTHVLRGHMELATTQRFLQMNCGIDTKCVILAHLSNENADREYFRDSTQQLVNCPVHIAKKGLVVDFGDLLPTQSDQNEMP